jgi:hypothetical protein
MPFFDRPTMMVGVKKSGSRLFVVATLNKMLNLVHTVICGSENALDQALNQCIA